jgi:TrmH family RNA methyltransferase
MSGARPVIESARNPHLRRVAELRDRRSRDRAGMTLIDGVREIGRALDGGIVIVECLVDAAGPIDPAGVTLLDRLRAEQVSLQPVSRSALDRIAYGDRSDGIIAVARIPDTSLERLHLPADPLIVVLESVEKPGNLGAVLRSADAAGADALIVADPATDLFNPNVVRASLGTVFTVPVAASESAKVRPWLTRSVRIVAARTDATRLYSDVDLTGPVALVLGSEAKGLGAAWQGPDVEPVRIPMLGSADSLNVSVAAAVLLYEARRQRGLSAANPPAGASLP